MNAPDILMYGHRLVLAAVDDLPEDAWEHPGVCGDWSIKEIVAHLASYELVLVEVLAGFDGGGPTPYLDAFRVPGGSFNETQVARRRSQSATETLAEYTAAHAEIRAHADRIEAETWRQIGTLPWYGADYSLDDFVVYTSYGHKREHCAQIDVHRGQLMRGAA
jgi:uncharacterized protein (TIGR03083 family)